MASDIYSYHKYINTNAQYWVIQQHQCNVLMAMPLEKSKLLLQTTCTTPYGAATIWKNSRT